MNTKRQQLINEVVEDLVATRADIMLVIKWNAISNSHDIPLIRAAHKAAGQRVVDAVMKAKEANDPQCAVAEYLDTHRSFCHKIEHVVHLYEAGCAPQ